MFKKRQQRKELVPPQQSLTALEWGTVLRSVHTPRLNGVSKDSKASLKSHKSKPDNKHKPSGQKSKNKPKSKPKGFREERTMHLRCQSVDLMGEYEKMLEMSKKMEARSSSKGKYPTTHVQSPPTVDYFVRSPSFSNTVYQPQQPTQSPSHLTYREEMDKYGSCKPEAPVEFDDLTCDEELDRRTPFPILRTPQRFVQTAKTLDRYGMNELSVVEERIISEEEKEFVSDKKKKVHARMPTLSTSEKHLCSANTAATNRQHERPQRSTSPFEAVAKPKKVVRIAINVNALVGKLKRTRHK